MEFRHLDALRAITEAGSFSAAAEVLHTVQSNVSEQIRQLERELGVPVLVRGRRGATPTEFGRVVLERARRIRGELEAMRVDLSLLQGLEAGHASLGVVGTASRWLVPALVGDLRQRAPGVMLRINEGASERLAAEVVSHELTMAVVTEPIVDPRLTVEHLLEEDLVGLVPDTFDVPAEPVPFATMAGLSLILPPSGNPFRLEIDEVAAAHGLGLTRSEEHTSELQSQSNLVCRLLLEQNTMCIPPRRCAERCGRSRPILSTRAAADSAPAPPVLPWPYFPPSSLSLRASLALLLRRSHS